MQQSQPLKVLAILLIAATSLVQTTFAQKTKTAAISNFNQVTVSSGIDLYLKQGNTESVSVVSNADLLKDVIIEKKGSSLNIRFKNNISWDRLFKGSSIKAYVTYKTLNSLSASGGSDVFTQNTLKTPRFTVNVSGGSDLKLNIMTQDLDLHASGGSDVELKGKANNLEIHSSGGSDIDAFDFIVENARVNSSGGSDVDIHVTNALEASSSGGSDIVFKGKAALKNNSSKSGSVKRF
ncbi:head GIN domain-containing protein [Pedobacter immunditicola]|uniref:head GIN domain-containing protein n=1 Tax=Pedobacter immunditicola TaxID=3133440 RepID=UPI0030992BFB